MMVVEGEYGTEEFQRNMDLVDGQLV